MADMGKLASAIAATVALSGTPQPAEAGGFVDLIAAGGAQVHAVLDETHGKTVNLKDTILLAQATVEDGRTGPYYAEVIQVSGGKKKIEYYRNKRGAIIPPPIENGKLVDGNTAPVNAAEARIAQKEILAKYDKPTQMALAMVGPKDLIGDSLKKIDVLGDAIEKGLPISKELLSDVFFSAYILMLSGQDVTEILKTSEIVGTKKLKMSSSDISKMKQEAEQKAKTIWKSTTGAVLS